MYIVYSLFVGSVGVHVCCTLCVCVLQTQEWRVDFSTEGVLNPYHYYMMLYQSNTLAPGSLAQPPVLTGGKHTKWLQVLLITLPASSSHDFILRLEYVPQ